MKKSRWVSLLTLLVLLFVLPACSLLEPAPTAAGTDPSGTPSESTSSTPPVTPPDGTAVPEETPVGLGGPLTLRIWLPPQFAPDRGTPAGALLAARLDEFALLHPGIRITVRIKAETGPGGIVSSLSATGSAVPEALPDLVLMPRLELERAVRNRLVLPLTTPLEEDWYEFATSLATISQGVYGLPFATDALVMLYRPDVILDPPKDWTTTLNTTTPLLFAGGASNSLFTFALYSAAGGRLQDDSLRPFLDEAALTALLTFFTEAQSAGAFAEQTAIIGDENIVYQSFLSGQSDMAVTWVSNRFQNPDETVAASGLPTVSSRPYTLVKGWLWAVSNPDPTRQTLAEELAGFLTAPEFMASWTAAAGYLPPRAAALSLWADSPEASLASRIALSANPLPALDVIEKTGPALQQALADIFSGAVLPADAARTAAARINSP